MRRNLKRGSTACVLCCVLAVREAKLRASMEELEARTRLLEQQLHEAEESGEPLGVWASYVEWFEERNLCGHDSYIDAFRKCITYFTAMPTYNSDIRLAFIYIKFAKICDDPIAVYKHMLDQDIGVQHAVLYEAYASTLERVGDKREAVSVLQLGISKKAQPLKRLQKKLESLVQQPFQKPTKSATTATSQPAISDQSERNDAFYVQPGVIFVYPKVLVYPRDGGEYQLEHVRAQLPKYQPLFNTEDEDNSMGEDNMEMTVAGPVDITLNVPVLPGVFGRNRGEKRGMMATTSMNASANKENDQEDLGALKQFGKLQQRKPLQMIGIPRVEQQDRTVEEELEKLCEEKEKHLASATKAPGLREGRTRMARESEDEIQHQLEQLMLERSAQKSLAQRAPVVAKEAALLQREDFSLLRNQENQPPPPESKASGFKFTPNTVDGGVNWPLRGTSMQRTSEFKAKLNFSEVDSLSGSLALSLAEESGGGSRHLPGMFNTTLECEKRVKLTKEQLQFENEFANSLEQPSYGELSRSQRSWRQQSSNSSQSFEVYHDSWMNQSKNASRNTSKQQHSIKGASSAFRPVAGTLEEKRRPLQSLQEPTGPLGGRVPLQVISKPLIGSSQDPSFEYSYDRSQSFQPSRNSTTPFSVYEDSQESSFVPFHDSWANHSKNTSGAPPRRSFQKTDGSSAQLQARSRPLFSERQDNAHPVLRPPVAQQPEDFEENTYPVDQTMEPSFFTQVDIRHPTKFQPASTPMMSRVDLNFDVSVIPAELTRAEEKLPHLSSHAPMALRAPPQFSMGVVGVNTLSMIAEESSSYKSSGSSSASSQASSSVPADSLGQSNRELLAEEINPFEPQYVNFMLNAVGYPLSRIERVHSQLPKLVSGRVVVLGEDRFSLGKRVAQGGFASIFKAAREEKTKALKVQFPPCEWEVAVVEQLHSRLKSSSSAFLSMCFMEVEKAYSFQDASVIVTEYHSCGTLLDLVNVYSSIKNYLEEPLLVYYIDEVVTLVHTLHECGIIHADIKPDNFMLRDLRQFTDFQQAKGRGLCLIDFGRAIDTRVFPEETRFVGSCHTEDFQCVQMLEGKPWKWEVDYFGVAGTLHVLLYGKYMKVTKNPASGLYKPQRNPTRRPQDSSFWQMMFDTLLNSQKKLSLTGFIQTLDAKLKPMRDYMFRSYLQKLQGHLTSYFSNQK